MMTVSIEIWIKVASKIPWLGFVWKEGPRVHGPVGPSMAFFLGPSDLGYRFPLHAYAYSMNSSSDQWVNCFSPADKLSSVEKLTVCSLESIITTSNLMWFNPIPTLPLENWEALFFDNRRRNLEFTWILLVGGDGTEQYISFGKKAIM